MVTSPFETPPCFSHLRTPIVRDGVGGVDQDRLADQVAGPS